MRRGLLTARSITLTPIGTFGNPATAGNSTKTGSNYVFVDRNSTSPANGTVTQVNFYATTAETITVCVGSPGATFTVRSVADISSDGSGLQSATVSMPVLAGDYFAIWLPVLTSNLISSNVGYYSYAAASTKPTGGDSYTMTNGNATVCMNLTVSA